jgi:transposase
LSAVICFRLRKKTGMSDLFWLTDEQIERLRPFFPKIHAKLRVDDRRVLSGIVFVNRNGLRLRDAPSAYGPHKTLYNRRKRWGEAGVFMHMMEGLVAGRCRAKEGHDRRRLPEGAPHGIEPAG